MLSVVKWTFQFYNQHVITYCGLFLMMFNYIINMSTVKVVLICLFIDSVLANSQNTSCLDILNCYFATSLFFIGFGCTKWLLCLKPCVYINRNGYYRKNFYDYQADFIILMINIEVPFGYFQSPFFMHVF